MSLDGEATLMALPPAGVQGAGSGAGRVRA